MSCELSYRYWNPDQMGEVNHMMTRLHPWHKLPQFWELASRKWEQAAWNWRLTVPKAFKMTLIRPPTTNFKMTVRADCAVSAWSPLPPPIKALAPCLSAGEESWPLDRCPPSPSHLPIPPVASIQNKANFLFYQLGLFIGFWATSSWTPLSITMRLNESKILIQNCSTGW